MALDPKIVAKLAIAFRPQSFVRVMRNVHAAAPLGTGASQKRTFHVFYLAQDLETGIAETIIRDRFEAEGQRELDVGEVDLWVVAQVSAPSPLVLVDLRTTGLLQLGVSTDAARAKAQEEGRRFSQAIHDGFQVDGLLYKSRLTGADCVAVYDRAVASKLVATRVHDLVTLAGVVPALTRLNVTLIREP